MSKLTQTETAICANLGLDEAKFAARVAGRDRSIHAAREESGFGLLGAVTNVAKTLGLDAAAMLRRGTELAGRPY